MPVFLSVSGLIILARGFYTRSQEGAAEAEPETPDPTPPEEPETPDTTPPRFRRRDWALVLFSIIVIAVGVSWPFLSDNFASENAVALRALKKLGARTQSYKDHISITFSGTHAYNPDIDAGLVHCNKVANLKGLYLYGKTISDAGLENLKGMTTSIF